jgi:mersacidin/lichenicidin family type 2 lantibiotic
MIMQKKVDINRALRDENYLASLSEEEQALVPANPAGVVEISDDDLEGVAGGLPPCSCYTCGSCCCG